MEIKSLSDQDLWNQTGNLAARERRITTELLTHLREIELRRLHCDRGYASLYDYLVKELRYSEGAAYRRIQALRLMTAVPSVKERLESGSLSLNTAAKIQAALKDESPEKKEEALRQLEGKSTREVDRELAPTDTHGRERTRWISGDALELTVVLDKPSYENLNELKAIKSHAEKSHTYSGMVKDLIELGQSRWNPSRLSAPPRRGSAAAGLANATRRLIWQRDGGRCTYVDPKTGRRCESTHYLQIDHIQPLALGGSHEPENLRLLCAQHNRRRAEKTFGERPGPRET